MFAGLLEEWIEGIGKNKVVQIIIDNSANYKTVGKLLMQAHCLDLML
jgi:hypothetical protein